MTALYLVTIIPMNITCGMNQAPRWYFPDLESGTTKGRNNQMKKQMKLWQPIVGLEHLV